jgi:O-antigen/teichoic acid export membrane protein
VAVETAAAPPAAARRPRLSGVVARLTAANVLAAASGFITGPLLARALGASGRGDLAAVLVPLSLVPVVLCLGIPAYAYRTLPAGRTVEEVIGSLGLPLVLIGVVAAAMSVPVADALAGGRQTVRTFLIIGFATTPLVLLNMLLSSSLSALERWRGVVAMTAIPFAVPFVGIVALYVAGDLTVGTAAAVTIAGSVLTVVPGTPLLLRAVRRPTFHRSLARNGVDFGLKSWLGGMAALANVRLDQVLMITVVPPRELGLYAVATTISGASGLATGALSPPLMSRIASGHRYLMPKAVRMALVVTVALNLMLAIVTPILLSVLFGPQFVGALTMTLILLAANVSFAGASVLSTALQADGAPLIPSIGEGLALVITVVGLLTLLGPLGGVGAALVSLAAYSTSLAFQIVVASRRIGVRMRDFLAPSKSDLGWALGLLGDVTRRFGFSR